MLTLPTLTLTDHQGTLLAPLPVARIICIARNYAEHAREMGHEPSAEAPFFFFKPLSALNTSGTFQLPSFSSNCQHELELVVALGTGGTGLTPAAAGRCVSGFALGLDMTARDLQQAAKSQGRPWDLAKGFDGSACLSAAATGSAADLAGFGALQLTNNGQLVQAGHLRDMLWPVPDLLAHLSGFIALRAGDLVFTGTPAGVAAVAAGDELHASLAGFRHTLSVRVTA